MRGREAALLVLCMLAPDMAAGQGNVYGRISISTMQVYDGNLNAAPASQAQGDLISRVAPAVEAGYRSAPLTLAVRYAAGAERYLSHVELSRALARQDAGIDVSYRPSRRLGLRLDGSYVATQTPGEFNVQSLIAAGRARAERGMIESGATYDWSETSTISVASTIARDRLEGGIGSAMYSSQVAFDRRAGHRHTLGVAYQVDQFRFSNGVAEPLHLITATWTRAVTRLTSLDVAGGPRFTSEGVRPEVAARLQRRLRWGELSLDYARTRATAIGERGTFGVHRAAATGTYRPARPVGLTATAELARSTRDTVAIAVRTLLLGASVEITRDLSVSASGLIGAQTGTLGDLAASISQRRLTFELRAAFPPFPTATRRAS